MKSIELNNLTDKFTAVNTKLQDITSDYNEKFSLIVCNPPYMPVNGGFDADDQSKAVCRAEKELSLDDVAQKCIEIMESENLPLKEAAKLACAKTAFSKSEVYKAAQNLRG